LFVDFGPEGEPLKKRVARHLATTLAVFEAHASEVPEQRLVVGAMPAYQDVLTQGIGPYLKAPSAAAAAAR
jgi:hypothetical protein